MGHTFAMVKSRAAADTAMVDDIKDRIRHEGIEIEECRAENWIPLDKVYALYEEHKGRGYYNDLVQSVAGPVVLMVLKGEGVIAKWRAMLGPILGHPDGMKLGTIRGDYASRTVVADNVAHGSDSPESAAREIALFFD